MLMKQSLLRIAAASAAAVFVTLGAVGPTYADDHGDQRDGGRTAAAHSKKSHDTRPDDDATTATDRSDDAGERQRSPEQSKQADGAEHDKGAKQDKGAEHNDKGTAPEQSKANPPRHTPVTVCHLLGNGSYHLLTFDDSALKAHQAHGDIYPVPHDGCPATSTTPSTTPETAQSGSHGNGHTPVTVCHLLGNGSYHLLTFDDSALKAHLAHGDLYPAPAGCATPETAVPPLAQPQSEVASSPSGGAPGAEVLGIEKLLTTHKTTVLQGSPAVLGVQATRTANRAPAQVAPVAGILPQTGAGRFGLLVVTGLGLLGAGGVMLTRKRAQAGS